jgi:hypothetical protein
MNVESECPYCGEPLTFDVDESGGRRQSYVEDCVVCCRPIEIHVVVAGDDVELSVHRQDE